MLPSSPDGPRLVPAAGSLGGQPRKEPPKDAALHIRAFAADGFSVEGVAEKFGVARKTMDRWLADNPDLREAFDRGREKERHALHNKLYRIAMEAENDRDASIAAMFLLKSRHAYREGDPGDTANKISVTFNLPGALTREEFMKTVVYEQQQPDDEPVPGTGLIRT